MIIDKNLSEKQKNLICDDLSLFFNESSFFKDNLHFFYIPSQISEDKEEFIAIKKDDKYYKLKYPDYAISKFDFLKDTLSFIEQLPNNDFLLTDNSLITVLNEKPKNEFLTSFLNKQKYEKKESLLLDRLDYILQNIALPARSNKKGFYETDKIDAIEKIISNSDNSFKLVHKSKHCIVFGKKNPDKNKECLLISSHSDIVNAITNVSSEHKNGFYHGTYDNLGTNAAAVSVILNEGDKLPDNVFFAFTDEEETGRCLGATDAFEFIKKYSNESPLCISLDVTDEGYYENRLCSIEGLSASDQIKNKIAYCFNDLEGNNKSYAVVKLNKNDYCSFSSDYVTSDYTVFDESIHYGQKLKQNAFSLCLPTNGYMHGNLGLDVKESVFAGYILSLTGFIYEYNNEYINNKDDIKQLKDYLVDKAIETKRCYECSQYPNYNDYSYGEDYEDYEDFYSIEDELREFASNYDDSEFNMYMNDAKLNFIIDEDNVDELLRTAFDEAHQDYSIDEEDYYGL